jgi:hypothetical protein
MSIEHLTPIRVEPEWRNYCVYTGGHLPDSALSAEHVIPRSLGGSSATVIRCSRAVNSRLGHEVDGKLAHDVFVMFGRRDADARGNSGRRPKATLKRTTAWKRGEPFILQPRYNIEVPAGGQPASIYDARAGKHLPFNVFDDTGFHFQMNIDSGLRSKFVAKTLLGLGWKLFGPSFLQTEPIDSLRLIIGTRDKGALPIYYADQFSIGNENPAAEPFRTLLEKTIRINRTTVLMRYTEFGLEWSVSCVGHFIGSIIYPTRQILLSSGIPRNGGVLLTIAQDRLLSEAVEPFPAPWGPISA